MIKQKKWVFFTPAKKYWNTNIGGKQFVNGSFTTTSEKVFEKLSRITEIPMTYKEITIENGVATVESDKELDKLASGIIDDTAEKLRKKREEIQSLDRQTLVSMASSAGYLDIKKANPAQAKTEDLQEFMINLGV